MSNDEDKREPNPWIKLKGDDNVVSGNVASDSRPFLESEGDRLSAEDNVQIPSGSQPIDPWYRRPWGVIVIGVAVVLIGAVLKSLIGL